MYKETKTEDRESHKLLQVFMVLLNIGVLIATAFVGWSVYNLIVRSSEIYNIFSGAVFS